MHEKQDPGRYLPDAVYGALDGIVTTFAVVAGVAGASLSSSIILVLGFANLIADGVSMSVGSYLQRRSEEEYHKRMREQEEQHVVSDPDRHREHVRNIYAKKGFTGGLLEQAVAKITGRKETWVDELMLADGLTTDGISPVKAGLTTFAGFLAIGLVPLLSYVAALRFPELQPYSFVTACALTGITLFVVGGMRSLVIAQKWWRAGLEMLLTGGLAASIAFFVGYALKGLVG